MHPQCSHEQHEKLCRAAQESVYLVLRLTCCCRPRETAPKASPLLPTTGIAVRDLQLSLLNASSTS